VAGLYTLARVAWHRRICNAGLSGEEERHAATASWETSGFVPYFGPITCPTSPPRVPYFVPYPRVTSISLSKGAGLSRLACPDRKLPADRYASPHALPGSILPDGAGSIGS